MANNDFMALFGPDSFTASVFSEANAVKYRLVVRGTNADSSINSVEVSINGVDKINRATQRGRGINLAVIDGTSLALIEYKSFDVWTNAALNGKAMGDYLAGLPANRIVCMYTFDALNSDAALTTLMTKLGSVAWPNDRYFQLPTTTTSNKQRSSYSAIYSSTMKKICMENFVGGCGTLNDDTRSFVEVVFDEFGDIGVTGIPERMVDDTQTYSGNGYPYKTFGLWTQGADVYLGDVFKLTVDLYISQAARTAGAESYVYVYSRNAGGSWISSAVLRTNGLAADKWHSLSAYYTVPNNATITQVGLAAYHYPSTVTTGQAQCRNMQMSKVPREEVERAGAAIGVNGVRMQTLSEVTATGTDNPIEMLLSLPVAAAGTPSNKKISSYNFAEMDSVVSDPGEYASTSTSQYLVKDWVDKASVNNRVSLSSQGINPGDTMRMNVQMKRDAAAITNSKNALLVTQFWNASGVELTASQIAINDVSSVPNVYSFYKTEGVVPAGAVSFSLGFYRFPQNTSAGSLTVKEVNLMVVR